MKQKMIALLLVLCVIFTTGCQKTAKQTSEKDGVKATEALAEPVVSEVADTEDMLVKNGDFSQPNDPESWMVFTQGGAASFAIEDGTGVLTIDALGSVNYGVQLYQDIGELTQGCKYKLSFDISGSDDRTIEYRIQINSGDYHAYAGKEEFKVTKEKQTETLEFTMDEATDPAPRLVFNCGDYPDAESLSEHKIYLDNVSLEVEDDSQAVKVEKEETKTVDVNVDQIGYLPDDQKTAVFRGEDMDDSFDVIDTQSGKSVYTGKIENKKDNLTADETDYYGDFTEVKTPGKYKVHTKNHGESYEFNIQDGVYDDCYEAIVQMLYRQRCGCETTKEIAGDFAHKACHTEKATIYGTKQKIDVTGGWHDAGDYGRYVVSGAKTLNDLFLAFTCGNGADSDALNIPESGNGVPDLLDEARYELEWMLKMQNSQGGVYHKVTCANFPGDDVLPEDEKDELIVCPVSTAATYDFTAVMIQAAELYKTYDKAFASTCEKAAKKAMNYAEKAGSDGGFTNPEGIETGEYADAATRDERFWAACEMYKQTGSKDYLDTLSAIVKNEMPSGLGWQSVGDYGTYAFLTIDSAKDTDIYQKLYDSFMGEADAIVEASEDDGYFISLGSEYAWGSNMTVMNNAMLLLLADSISPKDEYVTYAKEHLHYCLGTNPMSISYVTGFGTVSPVNVHHRPSYAKQEVMAGMLVGGPDRSLEDPYAKAVLKDTPPAKCYVDNHASYSTNEVTIYWNSPMIFVLSQLK